MRSMFYFAENFDQDVNGWNVSRVVDLSSAFSVRQRSRRMRASDRRDRAHTPRDPRAVRVIRVATSRVARVHVV